MKGIGGNQRKSRTSKIERFVANETKVSFSFVLDDKTEIFLRDKLEVKKENPNAKYFLKNYQIPLHLKNIKTNGYESRIVVNVPKESYVEKMLKEINLEK